jgi:hypothetical protein
MALQYLQCDDHDVVPEMVLKYQKRKKLLEKYRWESDPEKKEKLFLLRTTCDVPSHHHRLRGERMHAIDG